MFWDNIAINEELLEKVKKAKRMDLRVFKLKLGYMYRLNGNIITKGFKTRKEAIIHATKIYENIHG